MPRVAEEDPIQCDSSNPEFTSLFLLYRSHPTMMSEDGDIEKTFKMQCQ
jgi:hypothetical protein